MMDQEKRFGDDSLKEIRENINILTPQNTIKTRTSIWNQFMDFCKLRNYEFVSTTPVSQISSILEDWAFNMRRKNGEDYMESCVKASWNTTAKLVQENYYNEFNISFDPFSDMDFLKARNARDAKRKLLQINPIERKQSAKALKIEEIQAMASAWDENNPDGLQRKSPVNYYKRKESDTESESAMTHIAPLAKRHRNKTHHSTDYSSCKLSLKRDGPKWNPDRLKSNTLFIMGARANKVLGYGQTRGRLYVRHPNLVRYSGDQEDKEWLASKNLMPPSGGKAYLMLLEDIKELTESEEYRHSPNLQLLELKGFEVPLFLLLKIKNFIEYVRNERKLLAHVDLYEESHSSTPPSNMAFDSPLSIDNTGDNCFKTDFFNMSSDMSNNMTSSVISSILAGHLSGINSSDNSQDF